MAVWTVSHPFGSGVAHGLNPVGGELEALLARLAKRDPQAFETLYDRTRARAFGLALRMTGDRAGAEEVTQEAYLQVWRTADSFDPNRGSALAWITMIVRSRALDRLRSDRSYRTAIRDLEGSAGRQPVGDAVGDPEDEADLQERGERVRRALDELTTEQRAAIELAFYRGLSHSEIAEATSTPLGTVKSRIRAAVGKLQEILDPPLGPI